MKKRALIVAVFMATSPAAAQVATTPNQSGLLAPTQAQAPTTGVSCAEEMTATFCNVPTGPDTDGYGTGGGRGAASGGSGAAGGLVSAVIASTLPHRAAV